MPPTDALRALVPALRCPHCGGPVRVDGNAVVCERRHGFDVARQGYVNLLTHAAPPNADTAAMLAAVQGGRAGRRGRLTARAFLR